MGTKTDIAIIGGGLAGLTLAIQLAKAGKQVVLFEKNTYPFHKVCGEYVSMESFGFLERLGLPLSDLGLPFIDQLTVSAPSGIALHHKLGLGGFGISRYKLDFLLSELAQGVGVKLLTGTTVTGLQFADDRHYIQSTAGNFEAPIAIGTHGKRSNIDKLLNRQFMNKPENASGNYIGVKYHVKADLPANKIELHNFKDGYCGISRIEDSKYCLCYLTTAANLRQNGGQISELQSNVLMRNPYLKQYFNYPLLYEKPLVIAQVNFSKKPLIEDHVLMAGDAAGMIPPLCGNGMSMAMHASVILFGLVNAYLESKITRADLEKQYASAWHQQFGKRLLAGRVFQSLFGNEMLTGAVIGGLKLAPSSVVKRLISLTHGMPF